MKRWLVRLPAGAPLLLALGGGIGSAVGGVVVPWLVDTQWPGNKAVGWASGLGLLSVLLLWAGSRINGARRRSAGIYLHLIASRPQYDAVRFKTEHDAFRHWARQQVAQAVVLPRQELNVETPKDIDEFIRAARRDLEVGTEVLSGSAVTRATLLFSGALEAAFWLGWDLVASFRTDGPTSVADNGHVTAETSSRDVFDIASDAHDDSFQSHFVAVRLRAHGPEGVAPSSAGLQTDWLHLAAGGQPRLEACACSRGSHPGPVALVFDSLVRGGRPGLPGKVATCLSERGWTGPVMMISCHGLPFSQDAYEAAVDALAEVAGTGDDPHGGTDNLLFYAGPAAVCMGLGARLRNKGGRWCFMALDGAGGYTRAFPQPWISQIEGLPTTKSLTLRNLTPHPLTARAGDRVILMPSVGIARCAEHRVFTGSVKVGDVALPVIGLKYDSPTNIPAPIPGVGYVVSQVVVNSLPHRRDLFFPADLERNDNGDVVGFRALGTSTRR